MSAHTCFCVDNTTPENSTLASHFLPRSWVLLRLSLFFSETREATGNSEQTSFLPDSNKSGWKLPVLFYILSFSAGMFKDNQYMLVALCVNFSKILGLIMTWILCFKFSLFSTTIPLFVAPTLGVMMSSINFRIISFHLDGVHILTQWRIKSNSLYF